MSQPHHQDGVWYSRPAPPPEEEEPKPAAAPPNRGVAAVQPGPLPPPPPLLLPGRPETEAAASRMVIGRAKVPPAEAAPPVESRPAFESRHAVAAGPPQIDVDGQISARRLAAPAVTATPLAAPSAVAAADLVTGRRDDNPPPADDDQELDPEARRGPSGKMSRLHVGWHSIARSTLASVNVASSTAGLVMGHDRQHAAVPVRLFAPEPVRVALVGGVWAAQLLIFRAFALGARVTVITSEPAAWIGFGERATGQYNRLTVLSDDQAVPFAGTAQQPVLAVYDLRETGPAAAPTLGPWRSQLTILRRLDQPGVASLQDAELVLLQRLGGEEASLAASALRLRRHSGQFLQFMADDMMALVAEGTDRYVSLSQTHIEYDHVGAPRR